MKLRPDIVAAVLGLATRLAAADTATNTFDHAGFLRSVHVPEGFTISLAAGVPSVRFPMFAAPDDTGRLYVAESSGRDLYAGLRRLTRDCRITRLEDADGDGVYERSTVFREGLTFPMGLAWGHGRLYAADPPDLVALTDADGDGHAERRDVVLSGFGHTDNGSLHGLVFGPDGMLYFTMGEPDGWKLPRGDGSQLEGVAGALFRCRPDGTGVEVIGRGFVNLVEVAFLPGGEIVGTDNWYQRPEGALRDALVDCAPGGLYPYAPDRGTPLPRTGLVLPPVTLMPAVAHSGLARSRHPSHPASWHGSLLSAQHNTRRVVRHELRREGATFAATNIDFVAGEAPDFHPSDVLEDADGSFLIVDTGGWYVEHCPTGRIRDSRAPGGIYRVRRTTAGGADDPRGLRLDWTGATTATLVARLGDHRPAVRARAVGALAEHNEIGVLADHAAAPGMDVETRLDCLWTVARSGSENAPRVIRALFKDMEPTVRLASMRAAGFLRDHGSAEALATGLASRDPAERRAAAEALARCGSSRHAAALSAALPGAADAFEEHSLLAALLAVADEAFVRAMLTDGPPVARRGALHLLDQAPFASLGFGDLPRALGDADPGVAAAARALLARHPEWSGVSAAWLRERLDRVSDGADGAALLPVLGAFLGTAPIRALVTERLAAGAAVPDAARRLLLGAVAGHATTAPEPGWLAAAAAALGEAALRPAALEVAAAFPGGVFSAPLARIASDAALPAAVRFRAARIGAGNGAPPEAVVDLALDSLSPDTAPADRLAAIDLLSRARPDIARRRRLLAALSAGAPVPPDAVPGAFAGVAEPELLQGLEAYFAGKLDAGWSPGRTAFGRVLALFPEDARRSRLGARWEARSVDALKRLAAYTPLLRGGDAERGRAAFEKATCIACHRVGGQGGRIGPDLSRIGAIRAGGDLLESILYPSSSFAQGYEPYRLTRRDGEEVLGTLASQGPEGIVLRDAAGESRRVPTGDIAALERLENSAMPEGLEQLLGREELADLLAFLGSLR